MADVASPTAPQAEKALLGGLLREPDRLAVMPAALTPGAFYRPEHQALHALLLERWRGGEPVDMVTVQEAVARSGHHERYGGIAYVLGLPDAAVSTANLGHYAELVLDAATRRRVQRRCRQAVEEAVRSGATGAELASRVAADLSGYATAGVTDDADHPPGLFDHIGELRTQSYTTAPIGISTGLIDLDRKLCGGLHPEDGELIIIAGRPGMGKSALAMNIAEAVADQGFAVGLVSLEMKVRKVRNRRLSARTGYPLGLFRDPRGFDHDAWQRLEQTAEAVDRLPFWTDDRAGLTVDQVCARARQWHAQAPPDTPFKLLVVDFLQIMGGMGKTSSERAILLGDGAQRLHDLAQDLECTVALLSQLSRAVEQRANKRPIKADLKESSGIEQAADVILFPFRPNYYRMEEGEKSTAVDGVEQDVEVGVAKQRDGTTGPVNVAFVGSCVRFEDLGMEDVKL